MTKRKVKDAEPKKARRGISPEKFAKAMLEDDATIGKANLAAGYSAHNSRRGKRCASKACWDELDKQYAAKAVQLQKLGVSYTPKALEALVVGRLAKNLVDGRDRGAASARLLGSLKNVACFGPEVGPSGVFIIEMPAHLAAKVRPRLIDIPAKKDALN